MPGKILCNLDDLPEVGARGVSIVCNGKNGEADTKEIFVVRNENKIYSYKNSCPHTGGSLDWVPNQFLNLDKTRIQCATHDALFRIEDGFCIAGPCVNMSLQAVPVIMENDSIVLLDE